jgi:inner membrane protein
VDIVTQAVIGAACAQATALKRDSRVAALIGAGAGVLPDADALIYSAVDPLVQLEFHRHFSHALVFVPVGAAVAALLLLPLLRYFGPASLSLWRIYLYSLCGYAPGGLLDACTAYGTHLFWPFSAEPVAWGLVAVVDPVFTLALALPLLFGLRRRRPVRLGLVLALVYLFLGFVQHQRAATAAYDLAAGRGHTPDRLLVKPTIGNLLLWRGVYVVGDSVWVDALRVGTAAQAYPGGSLALFEPNRDLAWAPAASRARADAARFVSFAAGLAVLYPDNPLRLGDARYAMLPTSTQPLWGIEFDRDRPQAPPRWITSRTLAPDIRRRFTAMLLGRQMAETSAQK